jgi:glutathione S-transferase
MSASTAGVPELSYFDGPGRANLTRLAFVTGGTKFVDNRVTNWPEVKGNPSSVPAQLFGSMPVMKHDNLLIAQSAATALYAADLGGLLGTSAADRAVCTMMVATNEDLRVAMYKCLFGSDESKAAGREALPAAAGKFLAAIERALDRKGSEGPYFLGGDAPSLADLAVFDNVCSPFPGLRALGIDLAAFPRVVACADAVGATARVKAFVDSGFKVA